MLTHELWKGDNLPRVELGGLWESMGGQNQPTKKIFEQNT